MADAGLADAGAVDAGVGLDLDIALQRDVAGLDDLMPAAGGVLIFLSNFGESEAVGAHYRAVLQEDIVA